MLERRSKKHTEILEILETNYPSIKIEEEVNFGNNLFIDIYLPEFCIGIEIDGQQHHTYNAFMHKGSPLAFYNQKLNDRRKNLYFKENSLFLYRVSYTDKRCPEDVVHHVFTQAKEYFENIGGDTDRPSKQNKQNIRRSKR